jgi:hypothetical protein
LSNKLWLDAGLYCRLPSGYVDLAKYYLDDDNHVSTDINDNNILQLNDLNRRAALPTAIDTTSKEGYAVYGNSVLSRYMYNSVIVESGF